MNEERFRQFGLWIYDKNTDQYLNIGQIVNLLNKQQSKIKSMTKQHKERLNQLITENGELRMKIVEKEKRWWCIRHHKELTGEEAKQCKGCSSLSLQILKELPFD